MILFSITPNLIHTFLRRPALVQSSLVIPNRFASSRCVASTLRSLRRTYHSLCKSSNDFKRSSLAFHARPIHINKIFSHALAMDSCQGDNAHEPVQICFGKASPFSKNWANPLALLVVVVLLAAAVVVLNARTEERASRCNKDICMCVYGKERGLLVGQYVKAQQRQATTTPTTVVKDSAPPHKAPLLLHNATTFASFKKIWVVTKRQVQPSQ